MTLEDVSKDKDFDIKKVNDPDVLFEYLIRSIKTYHPSTDTTLVEDAYKLADSAHNGVKRKSGEPYIIHPLHVGIILAGLELDKESIAAALLHDVIEDTEYTYEDIQRLFGTEIADLVNGVTKLTNLPYAASDKEEIQAENLRKMFLAMAKDIRVILIKLADRLHNMRTLDFMKPEKQYEKSRETLDIYSPLAQRLGISKVKIELDDLALSYIEPDAYKMLVKRVSEAAPERKEFVDKIVSEVKSEMFKQTGINVEAYGRVKHIFSIYKKMKTQNKKFEQIYDVFAIRIVVDSVRDCYAVLGIIHALYKPVPGRFKDYIAMPKPNGYKSLHTTVVSKEGRYFEVQIRTKEMHLVAEYGIAAHWKYKEGKSGEHIGQAEVDKMTWLREILELQKNAENNSEFIDEVKKELDLFADSVFCFTPQGKVFNMPKGSTTIDFAYRIHTAVGNQMVGAIVNGKVQPITYEIQNGDRIQIQTSLNSTGPSRDWINVCKSPQARNKIKQWFKAQNRTENIETGRSLIDRYCKSKNIDFSSINTSESRQSVMKKYSFVDWDSVLAAIGHGGLKEGQVVNRMSDYFKTGKIEPLTDDDIKEKIKHEADKLARQQKERERTNKVQSGQFIIKGYSSSGDSPLCTCAKCCNPLPGDDIVGYITRNRGIKVHRTDCANYLSFTEAEKARRIEVEWAEVNDKEKYNVELVIYANDRKGILADIFQTISEHNINILDARTSCNKKGIATITIRINVGSMDFLKFIIKKFNQIDGIFEVKRTGGR